MFHTLAPDLGAPRRLILAALAVTVLVSLVMAAFYAPKFGLSLGDTDDAMRLSMVRDLLHGRGWYDQTITRLQPPYGAVMHWSRLVDGGIAGLALALRPLLGTDAEAGARFVWPLLWICPAALSTLVLARRLGGGAAVLPAAILLTVGLPLYVQFTPGRIDHHNVMISLCLVAAAGAADGGVAAAALSGAAVALGLAVGLEALLFCALIAAAFAFRLAIGGARRQAAAFGLALASSAAGAFLIQTPPDRWALPVCDAMGVNLVLGLCVGGVSLALAALTSDKMRILAVAAAGAAALTVYLAPDLHCALGPMAEIDPRLFPFWLDHVQELASWPELYRARPDEAVMAGLVALLALGALGLGLASEVRRNDFAWRLAAALVLLAIALDASAARMSPYLLWFSVSVVGAGLATLSAVWFKQALAPTVALAVLVSATPVNALAQALYARKAVSGAARNLVDHCYDAQAYGRLSRLPAGIVLSEIDLGPAILLQTHHAVLNAPYHRMAWGILNAQDVLTAPAGQGWDRLHALHVAYVAACPAHAGLYNHVKAPANSLLRAMDRGAVPGRLEPLSAPDEPLQLYRVR